MEYNEEIVFGINVEDDPNTVWGAFKTIKEQFIGEWGAFNDDSLIQDEEASWITINDLHIKYSDVIYLLTMPQGIFYYLYVLNEIYNGNYEARASLVEDIDTEEIAKNMHAYFFRSDPASQGHEFIYNYETTQDILDYYGKLINYLSWEETTFEDDVWYNAGTQSPVMKELTDLFFDVCKAANND